MSKTGTIIPHRDTKRMNERMCLDKCLAHRRCWINISAIWGFFFLECGWWGSAFWDPSGVQSVGSILKFVMETSVWVQMKLTTWILPSLHASPACASSLPFCVWEEQTSLSKNAVVTSPGTGALKGNAQDPPNHFHNGVKSQHFPEGQDSRKTAYTPKEFWEFTNTYF